MFYNFAHSAQISTTTSNREEGNDPRRAPLGSK